jgi:hypothetical protein
MSPGEVTWRTRDHALQLAWRTRHRAYRPAIGRPAAFPAALPVPVADVVPAPAAAALLREADEVLDGRLDVLGVQRDDLVDPDWFRCPLTGVRSDPTTYAFRVNHRSESEVGNVKGVWELSRMGHVTLLAAAWAVSGRAAYAERAAAHLRSWWAANPFLTGVHWTTGIEVGLRLIAWTWTRRLLHDWPGVPALFDANEQAHSQLAWHQAYLSMFRSRGSSANNHVVAEAAGLLVASCAFPWFDDTDRWRREATAVLERELLLNTHRCGLDREQASEYHGFVGMLGLLAAVEAEAAGHPLASPVWHRLCAMADAAAALVDRTGRPPRQGDGDDGRAVVLDGPQVGSWDALLSTGAAVFGPRPWWPAAPVTAVGPLLAAVLPATPVPVPVARRPVTRPDHLPGPGVTLLRSAADDPADELWCRCDGGPHGYLSIAGHAHADALSVEVRHAGVDVLADPGTYCYHGEPEWRQYFRSTIAHNTVEIDGRDQSLSGGPFLWLRHATGRVLSAEVSPDADVVSWSAEHDGYRVLDQPAKHRRTVRLHRSGRFLDITDEILSDGEHSLRLAFHLGPTVRCDVHDAVAQLSWDSPSGPARAYLALPAALSWTAHRGDTSPPLGWYAPRFGRRVPTTTLVGTGSTRAGGRLHSVLSFEDGRDDAGGTA